jgi:uncharacterized membrane protein YfhO
MMVAPDMFLARFSYISSLYVITCSLLKKETVKKEKIFTTLL